MNKTNARIYYRMEQEVNSFGFKRRWARGKTLDVTINFEYSIAGKNYNNGTKEIFTTYKENEWLNIYYNKENYEESYIVFDFWFNQFMQRLFYLFISEITLFTLWIAFIYIFEKKIKNDANE